MMTKTSRRLSYNPYTEEYCVGGHSADYADFDVGAQPFSLNGWVSNGNGRPTFKSRSHKLPRGCDTHIQTDLSILEEDEEERSILNSFERKKEEKKNKTKFLDEIKKFNICGIRPSQDINIDSSMKDIKKELSRLKILLKQRNQSSLCVSIVFDRIQLQKARECIKCGCSEKHRLLNRDLIKCGCDTCLKDGCIYTLSSPHNGEDILSLFQELPPDTFLFFRIFTFHK